MARSVLRLAVVAAFAYGIVVVFILSEPPTYEIRWFHR